MAAISFADDVSTVGQGKRLASWSFSQGTGANTINFRRGTVSGAIVLQVQVPANSSAAMAYHRPLYCQEGWFVEVVSTGLNRGMVDIG